MNCAACGQENPTDHKFCSGCGKPLRDDTRQPEAVRSYSVVLQTAPNDDVERFAIARKLAEMLEIPKQEAMEKVASVPAVVTTVESRTEAENVQKTLETLGLTSLVRPYEIAGRTAPAPCPAQPPKQEVQPKGGVDTLSLAVLSGWNKTTVGMGLIAALLWYLSDLFSPLNYDGGISDYAGWFTRAKWTFLTIFLGCAIFGAYCRVRYAVGRLSVSRLVLRVAGFCVGTSLVFVGTLVSLSGLILTVQLRLSGVLTLLLGVVLVRTGMALCGIRKRWLVQLPCPYCQAPHEWEGERVFKCLVCEQRVLVEGGVAVKLT